MNTEDYKNPPEAEGWTWYSICSKHGGENDENCGLCMTGSWLNDIEHAKDTLLYETDYYSWHKKHNDPQSEDIRLLKKWFPRLN